MLNIAFRVDSSFDIGIGHVMRCLTLAQKITQKMNANVTFFSRKNDGCINTKIKELGFKLCEMVEPIDDFQSDLQHGRWLGNTIKNDVKEFIEKSNQQLFDLVIIDHYAIDKRWHNEVRNITKKIMVIDDLGDREHDCDFLLDQTFLCPHTKYLDKVPKYCELLLGTEYALLREEFLIPPKKNRQKNILLMFGGTDPDNLTIECLFNLKHTRYFQNINVVLNNSALHINSVKNFCKENSITLHISPKNIAELMSTSILAIGAAGTTSWERCAMGLPAVVIIQADNQRQIASALQNAKVISYIEQKEIKSSLTQHIDAWMKVLASNNDIIKRCYDVCDGSGSSNVIKRVCNDI